MAEEIVAGLDPIFKSEGEALKAREAIAEANNSLYGSHGFFLSANGGEPDKYHLSRQIEVVKEYGRKEWLRAEALCAENNRLREALKPFADLADYISEEVPDYDTDQHEVQIEGWPYTLSVGWLREARTALREGEA